MKYCNCKLFALIFFSKVEHPRAWVDGEYIRHVL
jgi:hypothetical protein